MIKQVKNEKIQQNTLFLETAESPYVTLDKEPINEDIIWLWIEKQGLNPDNPADGEAIVEKLYDLAINNQGVVSVAIEAANHVIAKPSTKPWLTIQQHRHL